MKAYTVSPPTKLLSVMELLIIESKSNLIASCTKDRLLCSHQSAILGVQANTSGGLVT